MPGIKRSQDAQAAPPKRQKQAEQPASDSGSESEDESATVEAAPAGEEGEKEEPKTFKELVRKFHGPHSYVKNH